MSRAQFDAARLGFFRTLRRRRMSSRFVDREGEDLFAQACFEYTRRVSEGVEIADPPAWIVTCAWHRTVSLLESRDRRPQLVPIEKLAQQAGQEESGPEDTFLSEDRRRKVREAVEELSGHQRGLLALSYFEGESVREAARRLRWTSSKAQRAHESAQKRIREILGVESTDELQLEIGLFAFLSVVADRAGRRTLPSGLEAVLDLAHRRVGSIGDGEGMLIHAGRRPGAGDPTRLPGRIAATAHARSSGDRSPLRRLGDLGRRLLPGGPGEAGALVAGEGGTRALEVCKGLAVCVVGGGALTGALIGTVHHHPHPSEPVAHRAPPAKVAPHHHRRSTPPRAVRSVTRDVTPTAPETTPVREEPAPRPTAKASTSSTGKTPRVRSATPVAGEVETTEPQTPEAQVEEQFGDFASTEQGAATSVGTDAGSVADANTAAAPSASTGSRTSTSRRGEEAAAAKEFHGLLE